MYSYEVQYELGQKTYLDFDQSLSINKISHKEGHECTPEVNLNFDDIWYKQVAYENQKEFGCSVPFHPKFLLDGTNEWITICNNSTIGLMALRKFVESQGALASKSSVPCSTYDIILGLPQIDDKDNKMNESYIRLYPKTEIKIKSIILYYDFYTLAADVGGYIGMCLGISMIDFTRAFNVALVFTIRRISKESSR